MPYPTKYTRQYDFQRYQVSNPTRPLPGNQVNYDLNAVKQSVGEIIDFLKNFSRSDGKLANGSVGVDQLNPNLNLGFSLPTVWEPRVDYTADSTVLYANKFWKSKAAHTSSDGFDESKWDEIVDFGAQATAAADSAAAASVSAGNAADSESAAVGSATVASASASAASGSADSASASAIAAEGSANSAASSATAADGSATSAASTYQDFDKRFLGSKASNPTLDNQGAALATGALYWNTANNSLRIYNGAAWIAYSGGDMFAATYDPAEVGGNAFNGFPVATRTALAALSTSAFTAATLTEAGREGAFVFSSSDHSGDVSTDTNQGSFVAPASAPTGASGAWQRIRPFGNLHKTSEYGGDIQAALNVCALAGGHVEVNTVGTVVPPAGLTVAANTSLVGFGGDKTLLDFSGVSSGSLLTIDKFAIIKSGAGLTALPSFTSINAGEHHIAFSAAHGLVINQIICIYDSANGSWLPNVGGFGGRDYYHRGQRLRVIAISGNTVYVDQSITESYASGGTVTIYKQASCYGEISGLSLSMAGSAVAGNRLVKIMYGDRVKALDLRCTGAKYMGLGLYQSYQSEASGVFSNDLSETGDSYPLLLVNSSHTDAHDFSAVSSWEGVDCGGSDGWGCIQNYGNTFRDFLAVGKRGFGVGVHGNSDKTTFVRGVIRNGVCFAGRDTVYEDCHIDDGEYPYAVYFGEVAGGRQAILGGSINIRKANLGTDTPSISGYGGGAFRAAWTETYFELKTKINAPLSTFLIGVINDSASQKFSHDIDVAIQGSSSMSGATSFLRVRQTTTNNGSIGRVRVSGLPSGVGYGYFENNYACDVYDYPEQNGKQTITTTTGQAAAVGAPITFAHPYPIAPVLSTSGGVVPTTAEPYSVDQYSAPTTTGMRLEIWRLTVTAFTGGANTVVHWRVKL